MPGYTANTDELRSAVVKLQAKANEMRAAIAAVESSIAPARSMKSPRIAKDVSQWDAIKTALQKQLDAVEQAGKVLRQTATDIDAVMQS